MDINQNIVRIRTAMQMGTGIIYPCEPRNENFEEHNYIIFTNRHLIKDIPLDGSESDEDGVLKYFQFDIYNKEGRKLEISSGQEKENKVTAELFYSATENENLQEDGENLKSVEDIAVILLSFHRDIDLDLETRILWEDDDIVDICMEGFPQVLSDSDISSKLLVNGIYKSVFPSNSRIGVFQIKDDYHWYNNYMDYRLFQGFSGSPVFQKLPDRGVRLLGMNQSVLNLENGENPFKLMYYYKMPFILEYLREQGCILFSKEKDESAKIRWIVKDKSNREENDPNPPTDGNQGDLTLLLLGASGAGKSSFAKSFLLHSNYIDSTNDGQTTRSSVIYEISKYQEKPKAKIKFLNQEKFVQRMKLLNYHNYLYYICREVFGEQKEKTLEGYLRYFCYVYSSELIKNCPEFEKEINECNSKINELFYEKGKKLKRKDQENRYYIDNLEKLCEEILQLKLSENKSGKKDFNFMQTALFETIEGQEDPKSCFNKILDSVEGFFDKSDFDFLGDSQDSANEEDRRLDNECGQEKESIQGYFEDHYRGIHREIIKKVFSKYLIKRNNYEVELNLDGSFEQRSFLMYSLQKKGKNSLTGMVDSVTISDSVSNEYAFIFDDLKISKLNMIDTYGLDHADWNADKNNVLSDMVYSLNEDNILKFDSNLAVVYVKKLDSGKPTELHNIIPSIFELIPMAPIYCVFTGLDIFLGTDIAEFKSAEHYFSNIRKPKSYEYIISEQFEEDLKGKRPKYAGYINSLYSTLKNNLITVSLDEDTLKNNFNMYENNRDEVYKLLASISMNEYSNMVIIPDEVIAQIDSCSEAITDFLREVFKNAEVDWERIHWKTAQANYTRISRRIKLGYWGTYPHQWNQLFHMGYTSTVIEKSNILKIFQNNNEEQQKTDVYTKEVELALDSYIRDMEQLFLGNQRSLSEFSEGDSEFRLLLEEMYDEGNKKGTYKINPFKLYEEIQQSKGCDKDEIERKINERLIKVYSNSNLGDECSDITIYLKKAFLTDVCNFSKGFKYISDELCDLFIRSLKEQINITNAKKAKNMIKINREFIADYLEAKHKFESKYTDVKFETLIKAYIGAK
ncbi:hypothetical protein [Butyrivibrio sp. YAB3001]|uniref:hypothetical protein n=1 Tax=Butyrivibrio sp. YAB3001 TaxID=1520812 RepID=UPI0008F623EB|nr:hypothetical protein [Butyrivibrio sp. YAB3001]SFD08448.1 hypothetical protein SAMN02910398_03997 [Butyrivibrio sp. YAB3001]